MEDGRPKILLRRYWVVSQNFFFPSVQWEFRSWSKWIQMVVGDHHCGRQQLDGGHYEN